MKHYWSEIDWEIEVVAEKLDLLPLFPTQIPNGLTESVLSLQIERKMHSQTNRKRIEPTILGKE
jgi:hypothetical protein